MSTVSTQGPWFLFAAGLVTALVVVALLTPAPVWLAHVAVAAFLLICALREQRVEVRTWELLGAFSVALQWWSPEWAHRVQLALVLAAVLWWVHHGVARLRRGEAPRPWERYQRGWDGVRFRRRSARRTAAAGDREKDGR